MIKNNLIEFLSRGKLSVFLFHKVPDHADPLIPGELPLDAFRSTIEFITENFEVIPLSDAVSRLEKGAIRSRTACITFDDGYAEWMQGAMPLLEQYQLPATLFITTSQFEGMPMWHERIAHVIRESQRSFLDMPGFGLPKIHIESVQDKINAISLLEGYLKYQKLATREELLEQLESVAGVSPINIRRLTAGSLRELHSRGFEIGAHTLNHPILSLCTPKEAMQEVSAVREVLAGVIGGEVRSFAYPNGRPQFDFTSDHIRMVGRAGYSRAVTTQWGAASSSTPVMQIPRFTPWGPSAGAMALQMARNFLAKPRLISFSTKTDALVDVSREKPIKVLSVENGAGFGGAVTALQTLLGHCDCRDIESYVVTNFSVGNFGQLNCVKEHRVISDRAYDFRPMARQVASAKLGVVGKMLLFGIGRLDDLVNRAPYFLRLLAHTVRIQPNIIHGNNEPNSNREALLVAKVLRKPYVQHLRGPLGPSRHTPWLLSAPDFFVPVSRWMEGELITAGVKAEKIRQIYDAVELAFSPTAPTGLLRRELGISERTPIIAMIGMLVSWKGQDLFLDAVARMHRSGDREVVYLLIGGTPERGDIDYPNKLQQQVLKLGLREVVRFMGKRSDLPAILPEIDIVVSASTDPEPLGLVMLEAMANGCIFVGPSHGAATEVIKDGQNGYLFEVRSPGSLALRLQEALSRISEPDEMTHRARDAVLAQFQPVQCAQATIALCKSLI